MAYWKKKSSKKATGGKKRTHRKRKKFERGKKFLDPRMGKKAIKQSRTRGGNTKLKILHVEEINVFNPKTKKSQKLKMETVTENSANPNYVRRKILTKGALVKTDLGIVRITSRPGQEGGLNGVVVEEKK